MFLLVFNESLVVYVGEPIVSGGDVKFTIDCGYLIDRLPDNNFCIGWYKNGNPIIANSSCLKLSDDMRKLKIFSDDLCKLEVPIISESYYIPRDDRTYECKVSHAAGLDVDEQAANQANAGNEFYVGFFHNRHYLTCGGETYPPVIWVTTPESTPVSFVITVRHKTIYSGIACPNAVTYVSIPLNLIVFESAPIMSERFKGIRVKAEDNRKIIVFGQYEELGSNDAYVALPVVSLPFVKNLEYILVSILGDRGTVAKMKDSVGLVIGTEDNTKLTIVPSVIISHGLSIIGRFISVAPEQFRTITIDRYQTFYLQVRGGDITGTRIIANKPVSVFSGHECAQVPLSSYFCDMLIEQIPPTYTWGTEVVTIPFKTKAEDVIKIIASQHSTAIDVTYTDYGTGSVTSIPTFSLNSGQFKELYVGDYAVIKSNHPIAVFQISTSGYIEKKFNSDPFMLMVPSRQQYLNSYTITTAPFHLELEEKLQKFAPYTHYINIAVPIAFFNPSKIVVNGLPLADGSNFRPIRFSNNGIWGYGAQLTVDPGVHVVKHLDRNAVLSVVVYGFTYQMSYGYYGGLHFTSVNNGEVVILYG